jgi:hypothetical protein
MLITGKFVLREVTFIIFKHSKFDNNSKSVEKRVSIGILLESIFKAIFQSVFVSESSLKNKLEICSKK